MKKTKLTLLIAILLSACSTTATVELRDGRNYEGRIAKSNANYVFVDRNPGTPAHIPREQITDIDHPGNVHLLLGSIIAIGGIAYLVTNLDDCKEDGSTVMCMFDFVPLTTGLGIGTWGLVVWLDSKATVSNYEEPPRERGAAFGLRYDF